ncbi:efflux RND transporter periplasmic adaptor subunit [Niveispirillum cyanobacteriorum]|uniref:Efflux transporter periplasmic adaptor subunit n=1 Tax=Niveispirillum cyanobacteriorum TaxID=1612173 RepID=A0A2K9NL14_9PROT|nr:efflux RND transporter periplasmic adaptor subunit [Niveispirillum cyanobacteriorum]AUN33326.1 efflux transporter periplasmic adaptor subunit [Niveispirillum cyanobacteriorum]
MQPAASATTKASAKPPGPRSKRSLFRRRNILLGLAILAVATGVYWWQSGGTSGGDAASDVLTTAIDRGNIEDNVTAVGNLQPRDYVDVGTQVSGQLRKVHVEIGQQVNQGDLLAEIDPTVYQTRVEADRAQLENLGAQLTQREAELALAQQQYKRQKNLLAENATSEDTFQNAEKTLRAAEAAVKAVNAQIRQTNSTLRGDEANLGFTKIYAPMSGTVVSQNAKQGQTLNANQSAPIILRIADLSVMTVTTQVSEADVSRLRIGMPAYFTTLGRPDRRWRGTLAKINPTPEVVNNVVLYNALYDVENTGGELMTQMTAQTFFVVAAAENVIRVPVAAFQRPPMRTPGAAGGPQQAGGQPQTGAQGGTPPAGANGERRPRDGAAPAGAPPADAGARERPRMVQVLKADGTVEDRRIMIGVSDRVNAEVVSGLAEGDQVVVGRKPSAGQLKAQQQQQQQNMQRMRPPGML